MPSDNSSSESDPEFESIIATRARRSNAGSRLRQLLDLEETNAGTVPSNDDDENVNLLFEEDEDDREFQISGSDEDNDEGTNSESEKPRRKEDRSAIKSRAIEKKNYGSSRIETNGIDNDNDLISGGKFDVNSDDDNDEARVNSDEMLSESDMSSSDTDEEGGERELQKQERLRKRRKNQQGIPGILKKTKTAASTKPKKFIKEVEPAKSHKNTLFQNVPIAPTQRRHSSPKPSYRKQMNRLFGTKNKAPKPTLDDAIGSIDGRVNAELSGYQSKLSKMREGAGKSALKQRAIKLLRQRKQLESQRDQLMSQSWNISQAQMTTENLKNTMITVDAMRQTNKELRKTYGKIDVDKLEDLQDEMMDLIEQSNDIQSALGRSYDVPDDISESELDAELEALGEELELEEEMGPEAVPSYLDATPSVEMPSLNEQEPAKEEVQDSVPAQ
ncbi:hypothetical protein JL09_g4509 [Pichia kudriavzevii]|uniref:Vps72/YL1 N-terminal domain-containing protein n=1 Tax=Pichia kudriavzevii TaxID=4909 RepID=A0A099NWQ7_PICKU|nr:hypothetical protein JL09_g4509 [Pichia kudriavzevii]